MSKAIAFRVMPIVGALLLVGCTGSSVPAASPSVPLGTVAPATTAASMVPTSAPPPRSETTTTVKRTVETTAETTTSPILLTLTKAPSGRIGLLVFSATNNAETPFPSSFDVRLDELTQSGEWNKREFYTTGPSEAPGQPIGSGIVRTMQQDFIEAGETRTGLTIAFGDLPAGRYRVRMIYQVNVIGYNASRPELSTPLSFSIA
jgi:hypothetical protein